MARTKTTKKTIKTQNTSTFEGVYLLKMLLYMLLGSLWVKASNGSSTELALPVGLVVGLLFASHEHFRLDRKLEYVILLVAMLVGYFAPYGLYIAF